jgi:aralkylamine N-acetyltransferase
MIEYTFLQTPTPVEIDRLTELYRHAGWWTDDGDNPSLVAGIVAGSHCFLVARQAETIVAMGRAISDRASDAYIQDITVDPAFRGRGIGSRMVSALASRLEADGIGWIGSPVCLFPVLHHCLDQRGTHTLRCRVRRCLHRCLRI